jgi:hypothetical protein
MTVAAWFISFAVGQFQSDWLMLIVLIFAHRFFGLEVEIWIPKFMQNGVNEL